jgi:hypothetical protein
LLTRTVRRGGSLRLKLDDRGAGVWPASLGATVDGRRTSIRYRRGRATIPVGGLTRGTHRLVFSAADWQETKNNENVSSVLPNTRTLKTAFRVR